MTSKLKSYQFTLEASAPAIRHLEQAIASGQHWYLALLEAISLWETTEEVYCGRLCRYLINGEALDWLVLAERLCEAADALLPHDEKTTLLFQGKPPLKLATEEFKRLIGSKKYQQYLNFFYGITVEEALTASTNPPIADRFRGIDFI